MRFLRLVIPHFGALSDRTFDLDPEIVLVCGPNEAGKSSFRASLETVLFGYEPSGRDAHPLARFGGGDARDLHVEALLERSGHGHLGVERVLQDRGKLRRAEGKLEFEGKRSSNRPLTEVEGVSRSLFRSVYSLSAEDLVALEGDVRSHVDELLLGEKAVANLRPTFVVRRELDSDQQKLWRADNRGKPRSRALKAKLREAQRELGDARRDQRALREALEERERLDARLTDLRAEKADIERESTDAAYLADLSELRARRRALRPLDLTQLGQAPLADPAELARKVEALEARLAEPLARLQLPPKQLSHADTKLLDARTSIQMATRGSGRQEADEEALAQRTREFATREARFVAGHERLTGRRPTKEDVGRLTALPIDALRTAHEVWREEWDEAQARLLQKAPDASLPWVLLCAVAGGLLLLLGVFHVLEPPFAASGALLFAVSLILAVRQPHGPDLAALFPAPGASVERLMQGYDRAFMQTPTTLERFLEGVEDLREAIEGIRAERTRLEALRSRIAQREAEWLHMARSLGVEDETGREALHHLDALLRAAEVRHKSASRDEAERAQLTTLVDTHAPELERERAHLQRVEACLRVNVPNAADPSSAWKTVRERDRERTVVEGLEKKLAADSRWDKLKGDERLDVDPARAPWSTAASEARRTRLDALEEELASHHGRLGEIRAMWDADEGGRVARAEERVRALSDELAETRRQRDRLALLERILGHADSVFRRDNQPDVLRRASAHLAAVTGGRYTRLEVDPLDESRLTVASPEYAEPLAVEAPLSRGTRDQIYLCLRLGLVDHLDEGRARLPLVLDEALVHWDSARRRELYPLLTAIARVRQVFVLTCHEALAREAQEALGVRRLELSGQGTELGVNEV